ncbi:MAG: methyl-accepting chemotaxis protein, partial [Ignavibacteriaceae bacterium]
ETMISMKFCNHRIIVISPCIAKKREFEETGMGDYNITMETLTKYFEENKISLDNFPAADYDNPPAERAVLFSTPGGLLRTAQREKPDVLQVARKIEGPNTIYHYFDQLLENVNKKISPVLIDCLNCEAGCNGGTGTAGKRTLDEIENLVEERNKEVQELYKTKLSRKPSVRKIRKTVNRFWKENLYTRSYVNRSENLNKGLKHPSKTELEKIYAAMMKDKPEDFKNCSACGYNSCEKMAVAIYNNLNKASNCHSFLEKTEKYIELNTPIVQKLGEGDLTITFIEEGDSKIAGLFQKLNEVIRNISTIISSTITSVQSTARLSSEISSSTEIMAAGSEEQSVQTGEVAASIEQMTRTIIETTRNATAAAEQAKKAGDIAKEGGKVVELTVEGIKRISEVVLKSSETVKQLGESSDQIGEIIQVIDEIADQTNLLALNAAIEAARAGDQGRGFAVVADEVRKLAERTTKATSEIAEMIKNIQKDTAEAVDSMSKGTEEVDRGKDLANRAGESLMEIITATVKVVDDITQVAAASEKQSCSAGQISKSIEGISSVTAETTNSIQKVAKSAESLNVLTDNLQNLVSRFKIEVNTKEPGYAIRQNGRLIIT